MIKLYGYKKCDTCRKAEKALKKYQRDFNFIDVTQNPPSATVLKKVVSQAGLDTRKLFNTSGLQYRELKIKDKLESMNDVDMLKLLASNGRLIKRPIVTDGTRSTIGFKEDVFKKTWKVKSSA